MFFYNNSKSKYVYIIFISIATFEGFIIYHGFASKSHNFIWRVKKMILLIFMCFMLINSILTNFDLYEMLSHYVDVE